MFCESIEKGHGRIEIRSCVTLSANDLPSQPEWKGLKTIAKISRERRRGEKIEKEAVYYIGSVSQDANLVTEVARSQWGIENGLH